MGKYKETMIKKYGSEQAWIEYLKQIGGRGGAKTGVKKGFAANPERARAAGAIGGAKSKRTKKVV